MTRVIACVCLLLLLAGCGRFVPPGAGLLCPFYNDKPRPFPVFDPPTPYLYAEHGGDRDFNGHGPNINIDVELCISPDGTRCVDGSEDGDKIIAVIEYLAEEANPPPDGSTAGSRAGDGSWIRQKFVKLVATATATIASIDSPTTAHIVARSARAGSESPPCNDGDLIDPGSIAITQVPGGPVRSVALIGDTGGKDISKDDDCRCDTRVNDLVFNEVAFTLAGGSPFLDTEAGPPIPEPDPGPGSVPVGPVVPLEWRAGAWGACMDHMQTRSVRCVESGTGTVVPDMRCTTPRPRDTRPCGGSYCSGSTSSDPGVTGQIALCMYESSGGPRIGDCIPTHCDGDTLHQWGCHYDTGVGGMVINPTTIPLPCGAAFPAGGRCRAYTADDGQRGSACVAP